MVVKKFFNTKFHKSPKTIYLEKVFFSVDIQKYTKYKFYAYYKRAYAKKKCLKFIIKLRFVYFCLILEKIFYYLLHVF